jgi:hypothetical protein
MSELRPRPSIVRAKRPPIFGRIAARRRERDNEHGEPWWPRAKAYRYGAASVVALFGVAMLAGLIMSVEPAAFSMSEAAYAAVPPPTRYAHSVHRTKQFHRSRAVAAELVRSKREARRSAGALAHHAAAHRDPSTAPVAASSAPGAASAPSPATMTVAQVQRWTLTADGQWQTVVSYVLPAGDDPAHAGITFQATAGDALPLDQRDPQAPGAIVTADGDEPVVVEANSSDAGLISAQLTLDPPQTSFSSFGAAAEPVGPHLIDVGWTRLADSAGVIEYKIFRRAAGDDKGVLVGSVSPDGRTWHDDSVRPTTAYTYTVVAATSDGATSASTDFVATPPIMPATSVDAISGKGMFLFFSPSDLDPNGYTHFDPDAIVARAKSAGIRHIELRLARGTFVEAQSDAARAWLDSLIDKASAAGIDLIAWQVPRRATSADAATAVAIARYHTAAGNGFDGLALDIEDGDAYMGYGSAAKQRMVDQIEMVREAVGPDYLIVATVMSPVLTHWTNERYPYDRIAPYASVLQPMEYWHHFYTSTHHAYTQDEVTQACADSVAATQDLAGRQVPVNVAAQSEDLGSTGSPTPDEIQWCLAGAKSAGALGDTFFDWQGTDDPNWAAIAGFIW